MCEQVGGEVLVNTLVQQWLGRVNETMGEENRLREVTLACSSADHSLTTFPLDYLAK